MSQKVIIAAAGFVAALGFAPCASAHGDGYSIQHVRILAECYEANAKTPVQVEFANKLRITAHELRTGEQIQPGFGRSLARDFIKAIELDSDAWVHDILAAAGCHNGKERS